MSARVDFVFRSHKGDGWSDNHHPKIQITIDSTGEIGIWVSDYIGGPTICWADISVADIRALLGVCNHLANPNDEIERLRARVAELEATDGRG